MIISSSATILIIVLRNGIRYSMSKNNRIILIILSIFCLIMIAITSIKSSILDPLKAGIGFFLEPIEKGVNTVGISIYNNIENHNKLANALEENEKLQQQIDELIADNTRLRANESELNRLRGLFDLSEDYSDYNMLGARVIARSSVGWFSIFRIDKGKKDGIEPDMNVIAGGGLVGIVTDVGYNYATVRSIIDDISRVSAMNLRNGDTCIVAGDLQLYNDGLLKISNILESADIKEGDRIVTSNISAKYLPNILIGYATDISLDDNRLTKSGYLVPAADFDTLQEVLIITDLKESEQ